MPYFTAVVASDGRAWRARDVDVSDAGSLEDLADQLRAASVGDRPVLAVLEREDEWFALVRVDGEEDPRVFVSDMAAAERSRYVDLLAPAADVDVPADDEVPVGAGGSPAAGGPAGEPDPPGPVLGSERDDPQQAADADAAEDAAQDDEDAELLEPQDAEEEVPGLAAWAGDPGLLSDLGVRAAALRDLVEQRGDDPAGVLAEIGEACGFDELLEALR